MSTSIAKIRFYCSFQHPYSIGDPVEVTEYKTSSDYASSELIGNRYGWPIGSNGPYRFYVTDNSTSKQNKTWASIAATATSCVCYYSGSYYAASCNNSSVTWTRYSYSASSSNQTAGSASVSRTNAIYDENGRCKSGALRLYATAYTNSGYVFRNWSGDTGDADVNNASISFSLTPQHDVSLTANFAKRAAVRLYLWSNHDRMDEIVKTQTVGGAKWTVGEDGARLYERRFDTWEGSGATLPTNPDPVVRPYHILRGWWTDADLGDAQSAVFVAAGGDYSNLCPVDGGYNIYTATDGKQYVTLYPEWTFVGFSVSATNSGGVGTLKLYRLGGGSGGRTLVATESNGSLSYVGNADATFRLVFEMGDGYEAPAEATGLTDGEFTPIAGDEINYASCSISTYAVTLNASEAGGLAITSPAEPDADGRYAVGRNITITATPNAGYSLASVTIVNLDTYETFERTNIDDNSFAITGLSANYSITAHYSQLAYTVTASVDAASAGKISASVTSSSEYHYGDEVFFTATPEAGYSFEGFYIGGVKVTDGAEVDPETGEAILELAVAGDTQVVVKAKVQVGFGISYDSTGNETCSIEVNGKAYSAPVDVTLGESLSYALTLGVRDDDDEELWEFDCWTADGNVVPLAQTGTITPTAAATYTAHVADGVTKTINVYLMRIGEASTTKESSSGHPGAITFTQLNSTRPLDFAGGGDDTPRPYSMTYTGTRYIQVAAAGTITFGADVVAFYGFASDDVSESETQPAYPDPAQILSREAEYAFLLAEDTTIYAYYGEATRVTTTIAYGARGDSTMGRIAIVATTDGEGVIAADGKSATSLQQTSLTLSAVPANGYRFAGWYADEFCVGDMLDIPGGVLTVVAQRTVYAKFVRDTHSICEWEGTNTPKALVWRSKTYESSKPFNPAACRVDALGYVGDGRNTLLELTVDMFSAPNAKPTATARLGNIASQDARRLPFRRLERYMQVEVKANVEVDAVLVGTAMGGLAQ